MVDTFAYVPDDGPSGDVEFRTRSVKFGDGYEQVVIDGLNARIDKWPLKFDRSYTDIAPIITFLDAHPGSPSFYWTPPGPGGVQGLYRCYGYSLSPRSGDQATLSCRFERAFAL